MAKIEEYEETKLWAQCEALYAKLPGYQCPIGFIWYSQVFVNVTNLHYLFVNEMFRQRGIANAMLKELRAWYPDNTVITAVGNELSTPWLLANNFKKVDMGWVLS